MDHTIVSIKRTVDTTMKEAQRLIKYCHNKHFHHVIALKQTNGYGRNGRKWQSPRGNLFVSTIMPLDDIFQHSISYIASISIVKAIRELCPLVPVCLKWPNDILLRGKKVGGVLCEVHNYNTQRYVIIGAGINYRFAPFAGDTATASLYKESGIYRKRVDFLKKIFSHFSELLVYCKRFGSTSIYTQWMRYAETGKCVFLQHGPQKIEGILTGLDSNGFAVIDTSDGQRIIRSGDMIHG